MVLPFYQGRSLFNDIGSLVDWRATRNLHGNALQRIRGRAYTRARIRPMMQWFIPHLYPVCFPE